MDINQPFVTQEQKFKYWEESKAEIQSLRAKVASAEMLVEALQYTLYSLEGRGIPHHVNPENLTVQFYKCKNVLREALATYDKLSEVKHDTK